MAIEQATSASDPCITSLFVISGAAELDPNEISTIIGMQPTRVWRQNNPALVGRGDFAQVEWRYEFKKRPHTLLDDAIAEVLSPFVGVADAIRLFLSQRSCRASVICKIYGDGSNVVLAMSSQTIQRMSLLGCGFSFSVQ